jgi:hypothetical protein
MTQVGRPRPAVSRCAWRRRSRQASCATSRSASRSSPSAARDVPVQRQLRRKPPAEPRRSRRVGAVPRALRPRRDRGREALQFRGADARAVRRRRRPGRPARGAGDLPPDSRTRRRTTPGVPGGAMSARLREEVRPVMETGIPVVLVTCSAEGEPNVAVVRPTTSTPSTSRSPSSSSARPSTTSGRTPVPSSVSTTSGRGSGGCWASATITRRPKEMSSSA